MQIFRIAPLEKGKRIRENPLLEKKRIAKFVYPMLAEAFQTFYSLAQQSDKVLFHIKTIVDNFADQFPHKMTKAMWYLQVSLAMLSSIRFSVRLHCLLFCTNSLNIDAIGAKNLAKPVMHFRAKAGLPQKFQKPYLPSLYAISEYFLKKPAAYPSDSFLPDFGPKVPVGDWKSAFKILFPSEILHC